MNALLLKEFNISLRLALPLMAALLAEVGLQVIDGVMLGYFGVHALAAGALAITISIVIIVSLLGITTAAGVLIAEAHATNDISRMTRYWQHTLYLIGIVSIPIMLLYAYANHIFIFFHQNPDVVKIAQLYLWGDLWCVPAVLAYIFCKEIFTCLEKTKIIMIVAAIALPLKVAINYVVIFGIFGFPKLGVFGIGLTGALVSWLMFLATIMYGLSEPTFAKILKAKLLPLENKIFMSIIKLGTPICLQGFFEATLFLVAAIMMGWINPIDQAAHQIVMQYVDLAFLLALGFSQVAAIRVAKFSAINDVASIKRTAQANALLTILISGCFVTIFVFAKMPLIWLFTHSREADPLLVTTTQSFFSVAAAFVCFDSLKLLTTCLLRGLKDTFVPMLLGLAAYWGIGISSAYVFAFVFHWEGVGIWCGIALGIFIAAVILWLRWRRQFNKLII
ncbi:MAG: MATE family efflux transporter [Gammaproteobacteria bacterium]|nr:MATE family efflux transporter [Gammaproteobacteria bacterium]